jgi:hypothetical protein
MELCREIQPVGIPYRPKVQAFLSWFGRNRLIPNKPASRPTRLDFIGKGRDCAVPPLLTEGAVRLTPIQGSRVPRFSRAGACAGSKISAYVARMMMIMRIMRESHDSPG